MKLKLTVQYNKEKREKLFVNKLKIIGVNQVKYIYFFSKMK